MLAIAVSAFGSCSPPGSGAGLRYIEQGSATGSRSSTPGPPRSAVVTLVWLYLEILRLLAILRGDN